MGQLIVEELSPNIFLRTARELLLWIAIISTLTFFLGKDWLPYINTTLILIFWAMGGIHSHLSFKNYAGAFEDIERELTLIKSEVEKISSYYNVR